MKRTSPRISEATESWLSETFSSLSGGAEYILEATAAVYRRTVIDMKDNFSKEELSLLIDIHNGHMLTPGHAGQGVTFGVSDSIRYDGTDKKWSVDGKSLIEKLNAMSLPEKMFLEIWAKGYWQQHDKIEIEEYIK